MSATPVGGTEAFRVNQPQVIFESFGDETVLVNLDSGFYYSLGGCAGRVLELVETGSSVSDLVGRLRREFSGDPAEIETLTTRFLAELRDEAILSPRPAAASALVGADARPDAAGAPHPPFPSPTVEKFSDMQGLLLLDPIHEVDEAGWPRLPATTQPG